MKKRLIALLLAGTMAISLAACGSDGNSGSSNPSDSVEDDQQASTPDSNSESTPDSTEESAPPGGSIRLQ